MTVPRQVRTNSCLCLQTHSSQRTRGRARLNPGGRRVWEDVLGVDGNSDVLDKKGLSPSPGLTEPAAGNLLELKEQPQGLRLIETQN